jgi:hypothetical protein
MKKIESGVLVSATQQSGKIDGYKNIGDYIQSLAQLSFLETENIHYVDKERLSEFKNDGEPVRVIMNAWFMVYPEYWPPSNDIKPLLTSVHISPTKATGMLSEKGVAYLKQHGPVGCRDMGTLEILKKSDIPCYYSGCLTLTLGEKFKPSEKTNRVIFVDPYIESIRNAEGKISFSHILTNIIFGLVEIKKVLRLYRKFKHFYCVAGKFLRIKKFIAVAGFYRSYRKKFSDNIIFTAEYITQSEKIGKGTKYETEQEKLQLAADLVKIYTGASLVVTSRIHCALPCLAIGTPSLFVHSNGAGHVRDPGRFGGLIDLFNVLKFKDFNLKSDDKNIPELIDQSNFDKITNKNLHLELTKSMNDICYDFFSNDGK